MLQHSLSCTLYHDGDSHVGSGSERQLGAPHPQAVSREPDAVLWCSASSLVFIYFGTPALPPPHPTPPAVKPLWKCLRRNNPEAPTSHKAFDLQFVLPARCAGAMVAQNLQQWPKWLSYIGIRLGTGKRKPSQGE